MSHKLINPDGVVHDFAHKMSWGHNIESDNKATVIEFADGVNTDQYNWCVFHYFPIKVGDFIIRNMQSGKVGLFEVIKISIPDYSVSNHDLYEVVVNWCGYYDKEKKQRIIWNGYGIPKPNIFQIIFNKLFKGK